jgi:predicted Zn-dependent peptidase
VADADEHVRLTLGPEDELERLHRFASCLGGVERRPAAREEDSAGRQTATGRDAREPVGLGRDRASGLLAAAHNGVYTIDRVPTFERQTLDNGLRVLTASMPHAQSVSCFVMLAAGSRYETPATNGIAHFSEHMFFKGTERRPTARDIAAEIDAIGGEFNAFTGKEYTAYYVRCATEYRDVALDVLVDMIRNATFDAEEIEREKGVIIEEMNMYVDTPRDYISRVYDELVYGEEPLGWNILGSKETIQAAARETFRDYVGHWYSPERMVVGLGGNLGENPVEKVTELLGDLPAASTDSPPPSPFAANGRIRVHEKVSDQAHLCLGVAGYPIEHPDRYVVELLRTVLGGGMSSRLFTEVRERRGLAYYVFAANQGYTDSGTLYSQAGVDLKRIDEAVTTILAELRKIAAEPVPADELEKARSYAKGRFVLSLESPQGTNMFGLRREVLEGHATEPSEVLAELDKVTAEDVQRVGQDLMREEAFRLALIGPFDDADRFQKLLD